jgi:hypothetical protein
MSGQLPPLFAITPDDHAGYVAVASYTFLVLMLCLVATRVFTRWYVVRFIKFDDAVLTGAAVSLGFLFSFLSACSVPVPSPSRPRSLTRVLETKQVLGLAQSIILQMALDHGLGKKQRIVSSSDFALYEKVILLKRRCSGLRLTLYLLA